MLWITKNTDVLSYQTQTKSQETLKIKLNEPTETFTSDTPLNSEDGWMLGVTSV